MTATILNTKIKTLDNKLSDLSGLVRKTDYETKTSEIEGKYFTISDYNKFTSVMPGVKIKRKKFVNKSNISNLVKNSDLNTKLTTLATRAELKQSMIEL